MIPCYSICILPTWLLTIHGKQFDWVLVEHQKSLQDRNALWGRILSLVILAAEVLLLTLDFAAPRLAKP